MWFSGVVRTISTNGRGRASVDHTDEPSSRHCEPVDQKVPIPESGEAQKGKLGLAARTLLNGPAFVNTRCIQPIGLIRASILLPIVTYLDGIGAPVAKLLARSGLPEWVLTDPETLIPASGAPRLLTEAARTQGIADIGVRAGAATSIETLGTFGRLIRRARTLDEAVRATVTYHSTFSSNGRMWLAHRGERVELCQAFGNHFDEDWQQASHYILMLMLGIIRLGAGPTWTPDEVRLQTGECAALRDVPALSTAHFEFGQAETAIVFPRMLLARQLRSSGDLQIAEGLDSWKATAPTRDLFGSIVQVVETLSWERYPEVGATADFLGISVRTLQRYLSSAGSSHERVVDWARFKTAASLLERTDTRILDIALDLGYSDHAHFTRAFRRWAGCSPREFRRGRVEPDRAGKPLGMAMWADLSARDVATPFEGQSERSALTLKPVPIAKDRTMGHR
jgi:AraC-like DNA-binding protein